MSYDFTPLTDAELDAINLIEEGIYNFEVVKSERKTSKSGNPMAAIQLRVWDKEGRVHFVYDYLVFSTVPLNIRKVKHFCDAVEMTEAYKKGQIPEELEGLSGKASIGVDDEKQKPNGGMYPRKNIVLDYVVTDKGATKYESNVENGFDDAIPF